MYNADGFKASETWTCTRCGADRNWSSRNKCRKCGHRREGSTRKRDRNTEPQGNSSAHRAEQVELREEVKRLRMLRCNSAASDESSQESPDAESLFVPINQLLDEIKTLGGVAGTEAIVEKAERLSTYIHTTNRKLDEKQKVGVWRGFKKGGWDLKRNMPLTKAPAPSRGPAVEVTPLTCVLRTNTPTGDGSTNR